MDAKQYFEIVVVPAFERLRIAMHDVSLLYAACILLFHTIDYIKIERSTTLGDYLKSNGGVRSDIRVIQAIASAQKHAIFNQHKEHPYWGMKAENIKPGKRLLKAGQPLTRNGNQIFLYGPLVELVGSPERLMTIIENLIEHFRKDLQSEKVG